MFYVHRDGSEARCPLCGGKVWDNRLTLRNPRAPNIRCADCRQGGTVYEDGHWEWWADPPKKQRRT